MYTHIFIKLALCLYSFANMAPVSYIAVLVTVFLAVVNGNTLLTYEQEVWENRIDLMNPAAVRRSCFIPRVPEKGFGIKYVLALSYRNMFYTIIFCGFFST